MPRRLDLDEALGHAATDKRLEILRRVGASGSISQAAREVGVSYKAAWQALDMLANLAGVPLLEKVVGGAGGGGARLTPAGERLLHAGSEMARSRSQVLARLSARSAGPALAALGLRTSMRNQLPCTVAQVQVHGPLVRVVLQLHDGTLASRITAESAQLLGLEPGLPVLALCKATAVQVERAGAGPTGPAVNVLRGRATRVARGDVGDEVAAQLAGGAALVGFAQGRSGLRAGSPVALHMDEAAVVLALAS
ncbi:MULTISPECIES: TOBE domain-containing protein [Ramlibacter]|uniref:LysR family transcriptional regulator n=1 Tax=Ramlibacter pinisoli TaxID=2682844 RepID=A0A6N8IQH4_9BURK|nr:MULTISPECIES: TOBE domain-containing protein [Ramlibacter]MBA2963996.1 TOBE domain-containing protein [Ramlibacter sp. CGMCC 1.13660]MVQ28962.1 LysR family transcriptional regulator [Ramlibacter pinisoli]